MKWPSTYPIYIILPGPEYWNEEKPFQGAMMMNSSNRF
jgi:hypothetical protein